MQTTFYLKYRPQTFSELDSTEAREELNKIFSSEKIPHAFLFSGPKGIGKTSAARIVAKAVNCEKNQELSIKNQAYEPCNQCDNCKSITAGANVDIIEIDAASNRGIDDIKELREKIKLSPAHLRKKVYIIDEVHMLTTEAFNALLKTLEEPPPHAIFILCTTDTEKLPKTIVSRCQMVNFKRATKAEIVSRLKKICSSENLEFEEKALGMIVKLSEGSFRDATKILEQVSFSGKITLSEVQKTAGILANFDPVDLLSFLKDQKTKEALNWINSAVDAGVNLKILVENISEKLRLSLLTGYGVVIEDDDQNIDFSSEEAKTLIALFSKAYMELKTAVIPQLPLEMAVVEWSLSCGKCEDVTAAGGVPPTDGRSEKLDEEVRSEKREKPVDQKNQEIAPQDPVSHFSPRTSIELKEVISKWSEILERVKPMNHSVQAFLRACRPVAFGKGFLTLEVFYKFHKEQLETEKCRVIFEKAASEVMHCEIKLKCTLGEKKAVKAELEPPSKPQIIQDSQILPEADIMKIAEEIFNGGNIQ